MEAESLRMFPRDTGPRAADDERVSVGFIAFSFQFAPFSSQVLGTKKAGFVVECARVGTNSFSNNKP